MAKNQVINLTVSPTGSGRYLVKSLKNRLTPKVGTSLSEAEAQKLIDSKDTTVNITKR